jgi:hypothetical protein
MSIEVYDALDALEDTFLDSEFADAHATLAAGKRLQMVGAGPFAIAQNTDGVANTIIAGDGTSVVIPTTPATDVRYHPRDGQTFRNFIYDGTNGGGMLSFDSGDDDLDINITIADCIWSADEDVINLTGATSGITGTWTITDSEFHGTDDSGAGNDTIALLYGEITFNFYNCTVTCIGNGAGALDATAVETADANIVNLYNCAVSNAPVSQPLSISGWSSALHATGTSRINVFGGSLTTNDGAGFLRTLTARASSTGIVAISSTTIRNKSGAQGSTFYPVADTGQILFNMAITGLASATSGASSNASGGDVSWTSPGNIVSSNNSRSSATNSTELSTVQSHYLVATGFGFTTSGNNVTTKIPADATILALRVRMERSSLLNPISTAGLAEDLGLYLVIGGVVQTGTNLLPVAYEYAAEDEVIEFEFPIIATVAEVKATTFGIAYQAEITTGSVGDGEDTNSARVDHITMAVMYTAEPAEQSSGISARSSSSLKSRYGARWRNLV